MTKFKRLMALAAVSMLGIQLMGASTATAAPVDSCSFSSSELEITLDDDVDIWVDSTDTDQLYCGSYGGGGDDSADLEDIDTIIVVGDGGGHSLQIYLHDEKNDAQADWSSVTTWDVDLSDGDDLYLNGESVDNLTVSTGNQIEAEVRNSQFSFGGTTGDLATDDDSSVLYFYGGDDDDTFDASKSDFDYVYAEGNDGDDTLTGGAGDDSLYGEDCVYGDVLYGGDGEDYLDANDSCDKNYAVGQAWGQGDDDELYGTVVAPGTGDDYVCADLAVTYADVADVEWIFGETDGDAGEDDIDCAVSVVTLSPGDDLFVDYGGMEVNGLAGDDLIKSNGGGADLFKGGAGDDILKGKAGEDELIGGKGSDQAWGGASWDVCSAEVTNRCEFK